MEVPTTDDEFPYEVLTPHYTPKLEYFDHNNSQRSFSAVDDPSTGWWDLSEGTNCGLPMPQSLGSSKMFHTCETEPLICLRH